MRPVQVPAPLTAVRPAAVAGFGLVTVPLMIVVKLSLEHSSASVVVDHEPVVLPLPGFVSTNENAAAASVTEPFTTVIEPSTGAISGACVVQLSTAPVMPFGAAVFAAFTRT